MELFWRTRFVSVAVKLILFLVILNLLWRLSPLWERCWEIAREVIIPFLAGLFIAYLLHPVVTLLERRKMPRLVAVLLIYLAFVLVVTIGLVNAIPVFARQLAELSDDLPRLTHWYHAWMIEWENHKYFLPDSVQSGVDRVIIQSQERLSHGISKLVGNFKNTLNKLLAYAVVPFIAFYLLKDMKEMQRAALTLIPQKYRKPALAVLRDVNESLGNYIHGQMVVALLVGAFAYLGYWLIGMPYPFVLAALVAVTNVIPFIGPLIGAIPGIIIALTISTRLALLALAVNLVIQVVEGNILSPHIVGRSLHLHPLLIIFALLTGEEIAGIPGLILAVPILAVVKVVIVRISLLMRES